MNTENESFDLVIVGGAMVGATLALALSKQRGPQGRCWKIALIEANEPTAQSHPGYDSRSIALANGSVEFLTHAGIWPIFANDATPIETIEVSDRGHFGATTISAIEQGVSALGQVVELERAGCALWQALRESNVTLLCPLQVDQLEQLPDCVRLQLSDGRWITSQLIVGADGTFSKVRQSVGISLDQIPYDQTALIANISASDYHATAYERFTTSGPIALLPMSQGRYSLVWVQEHEQAQRRMTLDDAAFLAELQQAFGFRLARFERVGQRASYPLTLSRAERLFHHRTVLLGNAAQTVHPIAGQGFNLGLRDLATLVALLGQELQQPHLDPGRYALLQDYSDQRQGDRGRVTELTHLLVRLFSNSSRLLAFGRNLGLLGLTLFDNAKEQVARQAMGHNAHIKGTKR